jgi:hypothetical protein
MRPDKRVSRDAAALAEAIRAHKPKDRGWLGDWLPVLLQSLFTAALAGGIAVYGTDRGAQTAGAVQFKLEQQRNAHTDEQQRQRDARADAQLLLNKAEQIVTLVEKTPITNLEITQSILAMPYTSNHTAALPDDAELVTALVTLYFPSAVDDARVYKSKCADHMNAVQNNLIAKLQGKPPGNKDDQIYQDALSAGDRVIYDVMTAVGKPYQKRTPLTKAEVRGLGHR